MSGDGRRKLGLHFDSQCKAAIFSPTAYSPENRTKMALSNASFEAFVTVCSIHTHNVDYSAPIPGFLPTGCVAS